MSCPGLICSCRRAPRQLGIRALFDLKRSIIPLSWNACTLTHGSEHVGSQPPAAAGTFHHRGGEVSDIYGATRTPSKQRRWRCRRRKRQQQPSSKTDNTHHGASSVDCITACSAPCHRHQHRSRSCRRRHCKSTPSGRSKRTLRPPIAPFPSLPCLDALAPGSIQAGGGGPPRPAVLGGPETEGRHLDGQRRAPLRGLAGGGRGSRGCG